MFLGHFRPTSGGEYRIVTSCRETGKSIESTISIPKTQREQIGMPGAARCLGRDFASIARPEFLHGQDGRTLPDDSKSACTKTTRTSLAALVPSTVGRVDRIPPRSLLVRTKICGANLMRHLFHDAISATKLQVNLA